MQKIAKSRRKRQKRNDEIDIKRKNSPDNEAQSNKYKTQNCVAKTRLAMSG